MRVRGVDLNVQVTGEGPAFVWGHGLMLSVEAEDRSGFEWGKFPRHIRLVRYDARGHGRSEPSYSPDDYRWPCLAQDMLAIADAIEAERFVAGGGSLGCATSLYAAMQAPQRIKALVLFLPPTAWETRARQAWLYRRLAIAGGVLGGRLLARFLSGHAERFLPAWLVQARPDMADQVSLGLSALQRRTVWNLFRGMAQSDLPPREAFRAIVHIPTLIMGWAGDPTHPVSSAEELRRLLSGSELFIAHSYNEFKIVPRRLRAFVGKFA